MRPPRSNPFHQAPKKAIKMTYPTFNSMPPRPPAKPRDSAASGATAITIAALLLLACIVGMSLSHAGASGQAPSKAKPQQGATPAPANLPPPPAQPAPPAPLQQKDFDQAIASAKKMIGAETGFGMVIEKPFLVVSSSGQATAQKWAEGTVRWASERLKKEYFARDPDHVITIWLFSGKTPYEKYNKQFWGSTPTTPYGYYSSTHKVLVMNIATGGGTLVHEIVHPYMATNFPECPAWFNEGMGSLYEQSVESRGSIRGVTNWRLAGLKEAIQEAKLPTFKDLTGYNPQTFYGQGSGTHYAQARYLLYYLQEKELLNKYFKSFLENRLKDPSGYETLQTVLGEKDMADFQKRWQTWAMKLKYP